MLNQLYKRTRLFLLAGLAILLLLSVLTTPIVHAYTSSLYEYQDTGLFDVTLFGATWAAQSFTTVEGFTITSAQLRLYRDGSPGIITASIRAANGLGIPTGGDYCAGSYDGNSVGLAPGWVEFTFGGGAALAANSRYAIVLSVPFGGAGDDINWKFINGNPYTGGQACDSADSGVTWAALWIPNTDYAFRTYGHPTPIPDAGSELMRNLLRVVLAAVILVGVVLFGRSGGVVMLFAALIGLITFFIVSTMIISLL